MFWFFLSIFIVTDSILFYKGYNTYLWQYKTNLEKQVQLDRFGFEKVTIKSNVTENEIHAIANGVAARFAKETAVIGKDGAAFDDLIRIIKEELTEESKSLNIPKN